MEQQAKDYLGKRDWLKAVELYNKLLLTKPHNKDTVVSYLDGRSQCLLELGQYEGVVNDCKKILKLSDCKDDGNDKVRSRLVQALFALQRYADAEFAVREWFAVSKNLEAPKLLERLHITMQNTQQKPVNENELRTLTPKLQNGAQFEVCYNINFKCFACCNNRSKRNNKSINIIVFFYMILSAYLLFSFIYFNCWFF